MSDRYRQVADAAVTMEGRHAYNTRSASQDSDRRGDDDRDEDLEVSHEREGVGATSAATGGSTTPTIVAGQGNQDSDRVDDHAPTPASTDHLIQLGKELGLSGKDLVDFVKEEKAAERQEREREREREERERDRHFELERLRLQSEAAANSNNNSRRDNTAEVESRFTPKIP